VRAALRATSAIRRAVRAPRAAVLVAALAVFAPSAPAAADGADGSFERRESSHFVLFQDVAIDESGGFYGSRRFEQQVLGELERAYDSLERWLDLRPDRKIEVVVYDPDAFDAHFGGLFRFRAAGFYHGVIRVRGDTRLTTGLSRVLHHELVHAALDAAAPSFAFPGWVNEGGAEWFEVRTQGKRGISSRERAFLAKLAREGGLHGLRGLSARAFGHLGGRAAQVAYLESYALIDYLARSYGERKLARFYAELIRSRNLERSLDRVFRLDSRELEERFRKDLG